MTNVAVNPGPETAAALLSRASQLVPRLKERSFQTEQLRQVPSETVQDLIASGLLRIGNPGRYGSAGEDIDVMFEVAWELSRGCGSTGWCYGQWTIHNWLIGHYPEQAQEEYYAGGPDTLCSSGLNMVGVQAKPVDGGFRVSGRWEFSSGCDAASWAILALPGTNNPVWALVPRREYEIDHDTWFVSGLRGTGSKDLVIQDAFIPAYRIMDPERPGSAELTGWEIHGRLSYRVPMRSLTGWTALSSLGGMALGAIDEFTARLRGTAGPGRTADSVALQLRLAESSAELDAAHALVRHNIRLILDKAARGEPVTGLERARGQRDCAFAARHSVQAVNRLFEASGAHALADSQPLQRFHRDVHSASHHAVLNWDAAAEHYGQLTLGAQ